MTVRGLRVLNRRASAQTLVAARAGGNRQRKEVRTGVVWLRDKITFSVDHLDRSAIARVRQSNEPSQEQRHYCCSASEHLFIQYLLVELG